MTARLSIGKPSTGKWHISEDGVARKCRATKRPCKLQHYNSEKEANTALEKEAEKNSLEAEKNYLHKSRSLNHALAYKNAHPEDDDRIINSIIDEGLRSGKMVTVPARNDGDYSLPLRKVKQSAKTMAITKPMHDDYQKVLNNLNAFEDKYINSVYDRTNNVIEVNDEKEAQDIVNNFDTDFAVVMQSYDNINADYDEVRKATGDWSLGDVIYTNKDGTGAFEITNTPIVDTKLLNEDLEKYNLLDAAEDDVLIKYRGGEYDDDGNLIRKPNYSLSKVQEIFNDSIKDSVTYGEKGAPAKRRKMWDDAGLSFTNVTVDFDPKSYGEIASKHSDMVISRKMTADKVASMTEAQKRAALCELGMQRASFENEVGNIHQFLNDGKGIEKDALTGKSKNFTYDGIPSSLTLKAKTRREIDPSTAGKWLKAHGYSDDDYVRNSATTVHVDDLRKFAKKHKQINYYKYVKPRKAFTFRDPTGETSNGRAYGFSNHISPVSRVKLNSKGKEI